MGITQEARSKLAQIASRSAFPAINGRVEKVVNDEVEMEKGPAPSIPTGTPSPRLRPVSEKANRSERISSVGKDSIPAKKVFTHPLWCQGTKCCAFNHWKARCNHEKAMSSGFAEMTACPEADMWARMS